MTIRQLSALKSLRQDSSRVPRRPDASIISDSIPLFFIGRNRYGFWVACEASGRSGGIFLLKGSALRFARKKNASSGVATMLVGDPLELATANGGGRLAAALLAALDVASRRAPAALALVSMAVRKWRLLVTQIVQ